MESGAEAEVGELDVAIAVDEYVVGLDVAVYEAERVHALDGARELADVEARQRLVEHLQLDEQIHEVAARHVVHHEVEALLVLERVVELDDPLGVGLGEYVALGLDMCRLLAVEYVALVEYFHGVEALGVGLVTLAHQADLAEGADADHADHVEHVRVELGAPQAQVVALLLAQEGAHLLLERGRQRRFAHLALELVATVLARLVALQHVLRMLLHEELERLWRARAHHSRRLVATADCCTS